MLYQRQLKILKSQVLIHPGPEFDKQKVRLDLEGYRHVDIG